MTLGTTASTVAAVLADVERWKADEEARHKAEMVEVEQEIKNLQTAIGNLQQQLEALTRFRSDLDGKASALGDQEVQRAYSALFDALGEQAKRLAARERLVGDKARERASSLAATLGGSDLGPLVQEYEQFKAAVEPTLGSLPQSYRDVILEHHANIAGKLRGHIDALTAGPIEVEAEALQVDVVYAIDAPDGAPELLVFVLPVDETVHSGWLDREDGLQLWLAARVVQAVYETSAKTGFVRAQAMAGGHRGLLVVEVDLAGADPAFVEGVERRLGELLSQAPELAGARVEATPRKVEVDYILPPDDGANGEE